MNMYLE